MRPPTQLIALSLAANVTLLGALMWQPAFAPPALRKFLVGLPAPQSSTATGVARAAAEAPPRAAEVDARLWPALQSDDMRALIARLRAAGFPAAVVRSIVAAHLNARLSARLLDQVGTSMDTPYWKSDSLGYGAFGESKMWNEYNQLHLERSQQMRELLKDEFFAESGEISDEQRRRFGNLPKNKVDRIERINADYAEISSQVRATMQGVNLAQDREKFALLERERRADLAAALSPAEFAEYEMRASLSTGRYRATFTLMDASEEEVRTVYRLQQALDERLRATRTDDSPAALALRDGTAPEFGKLQQYLRAALGDQRYADYRRANTSEFQQLSALVQRDNLPSDTAVRAFSLRETVEQESNRIFNDPAQTAEQKRAALAVLAQNTRAQLLATLGATIGPVYLQRASYWLNGVEHGQAVSFGPNGATNFQKLPDAPPR